MSYKEEIKLLLKQELESTPQYTECNLLKQFIIQKINEPPIVNMNLNYVFSTPFNDEELLRFMLCYKILFGVDYINISKTEINIDLTNFLN